MKELLQGLVAPTQKESGCIVYELLQNTSDPTDFTFVEEWQWQSEASLKDHLPCEHVHAVLPKLEAVTVEPPDIRTYWLVG